MEVKCPVCGAPLDEGRCGYCGYENSAVIQKNENVDQSFEHEEMRQQQVTNNNTLITSGIIPGVSRKSKMVALILCIFLGGLGAHRFYVGKVGTGILYVLTGGLCGFGWIIDIILVATGAFKDEFGLPLQQ